MSYGNAEADAVEEAQAYAKACEKTAALNQRENVSLKTELSKLQAKLDKECAQHAETKRQLTELDARYTPLVTENDELRERVAGLEGARSLASARSGKLTENSGVKLAAAEARVRELEAAEATWSGNVTRLIEEKAFAESKARALRERIERAIGVLEGQSFLGRRIERALEVLRGS